MATIHPQTASDKPSPDSRSSFALAYARQGWPVFPIHTPTDYHCSCGTPKCKDIGKHPRTPHGWKDATTDEAMIRHWWTRWPQANIGGSTGAVSGFIGLDIDPRHEGDARLRDLERQCGKLPDTVESLTAAAADMCSSRIPACLFTTTLAPSSVRA